MEELLLSYRDENCGFDLSTRLREIRACHGELVWLCIGTDKQIADSLGPLIGTMLYCAMPQLNIAGKLEAPVHAKNIRPMVRSLRESFPQAAMIAIDAAAGPAGQLGRICLRQGGLLPGKALAKNIPRVGDYALTVVVQGSGHFKPETKAQGLSFIYNLAEIISRAVIESYTEEIG
ncbi:MAG: spore protease YyaC [Syntrophomonadaceae bacterium]|nr:spore protease YyaC [Syntrophomonadaceae bacterium]